MSKYLFYQPVLFTIQGLTPDSGVLPSGQPGEKEANEVYLCAKEIDAILRSLVEDRIASDLMPEDESWGDFVIINFMAR